MTDSFKNFDLNMGRHINIKKGLDIKLAGKAKKELIRLPHPETFAVKPPDFHGVVPRLLVNEGDEVKAGTPLFSDKSDESVVFCSPVSGEIAAIHRGEKRRILEIKIIADKQTDYISFEKLNPVAAGREKILELMLKSGVWPVVRQRPFGSIASPGQNPKSIFISAFDTHPLAPDYNFIMQGGEADFQAGLEALKQLSDGKLHLNVRAGEELSPVFANAKGVEINNFSGPHPAGNVGVQIHHLDPVDKGEVVWCVNPQDVAIIGRLMNKGIYDATKIVALTGSQVMHPRYYEIVNGSSVKHILQDGEVKESDHRVISGNVLTGAAIPDDGYIGFYDSQITVIAEGTEPEFMGWLLPGLKKFSKSRAYFSWLAPGKEYDLDTSLHGEERPFVISGQYESVFPMDIYPVHLLKAILVEDIDLMESLGIYEVVEEDFALCEFVCTSKIESQRIIRQGLDLIKRESA